MKNLASVPPLRSGLAATRHPFGDGLHEAEAQRPEGTATAAKRGTELPWT